MRGLSGIAAGALALIVLQVLGTSTGVTGTKSAFVWLNTALTRALAPDVAAIPNLPERAKKRAKRQGPATNAPTIPSTMPTNPIVTI